MLGFFDVDPAYTAYLRQFDPRIPHIVYAGNSKFVCGVVLAVAGHSYFAPISSNTARQQTSLIIRDDKGNALSSLKFSFMFPAPLSVMTRKDFGAIRAVDPAYADLLQKEYLFCKKNEALLQSKAAKIYQIGCNPNHVLHRHCCDFPLLEVKMDEWLAQQTPPPPSAT